MLYLSLIITVISSFISCKKDAPDSLKVGLIAYYPLNGSTNDASGNGYNGIPYSVASVPDRFGKPNSAAYFDGQTSYIQVGDSPDLRLGGTDFTLNAWVKLDAYNTSYASSILSKRLPGGADKGWLWSIHGNVDANAGQITFGQGSGGFNSFSHTNINTGSWHMLTGIYNYAAQVFYCYIDGVLDNTTNNIPTNSPTISSALYIGRDNRTINDNGYFFEGSLDEIRLYKRQLSNVEIQKLYTNRY